MDRVSSGNKLAEAPISIEKDGKSHMIDRIRIEELEIEEYSPPKEYTPPKDIDTQDLDDEAAAELMLRVQHGVHEIISKRTVGLKRDLEGVSAALAIAAILADR